MSIRKTLDGNYFVEYITDWSHETAKFPTFKEAKRWLNSKYKEDKKVQSNRRFAMTHEEIAKRMNLDKSTVRFIERRALKKLERLLGCNLTDLL